MQRYNQKDTCRSYIYGFILSNSLLLVYTTRLLYTQICSISKGFVVEEINYYISSRHNIYEILLKLAQNTNATSIQASQNNRQWISNTEINIMQTECITLLFGILERIINSDTKTRTVQIQR